MKLKINRVIFYGYAFIIFLMVAGYWYFNKKSTEDLNLLHASITNVIGIEGTIGKDFSTLISTHNQYNRDPSPPGYQAFLESAQTLRDELGTMHGLLLGNIAQRVSGKVEQIVNSLNSLTETGQGPGSPNRGAALSTNALLDQSNIINIIRVELQSIFQDVLGNEIEAIPVIKVKNDQLSILVFIGVILISILWGFFFSTKIRNRINGISNQILEISEQIHAAANREESAFRSQSTSLDYTAQTLDEFSKAANDMASNAEDASEQMENSADRMADLQQKARQIDKISTTIEEVTTQINILSLNASIEATRAGDQGKGFSAVASEIRRLAEDTKGFTDTIGLLIQEMQGSTQKMVDFSGQAVQLVQGISSAVSKQTEATDEINKSVSKINVSMKSISENIRVTVEFAENLLDVANQMKALT